MLLVEAEEEYNAAYEELVDLTRDLLKAFMMSFSVSDDDKFLLEDEKSLLERKNSLLEEAHENYGFWEKRLEGLKKYDHQRFFSQLENKDDIDSFLLDIQGID